MNNPRVKVYISILLVFIFTIGWVYPYLHDTDIYNFILIGKNFVNRSNKSEIINSKAKYAHYPDGYDGQFYYYIALDPVNAYHYIDDASYRYARIIYPMFARVFSFGNPDNIPYLLLIINVSSIIISTYFLALWFKRNNLSPYFSLIYGLYPGIHLATQRDLTEPLAYTFVIIAIFLYYSEARYKLILSSVFFASALLTREITVLFPLIYGVDFFLKFQKNSISLKKNFKDGIIFCLISFTPFIFYKLSLIFWLGTSSRHFFELIPFYGILKFFPFGLSQLQQIQTVIIPALITGSLGSYFIRKGHFNSEIIILLLNISFLVIFLADGSFLEAVASGRISIGIVLAALLCLPIFIKLNKQSLIIFMFAVTFWFQAWIFLPFYNQFNINYLIYLITIVVFVDLVYKEFLIKHT